MLMLITHLVLQVLTVITTGTSDENLTVQAHQDLLLKSLSLPGYIAAVLSIKFIGVKRLQEIGLLVMAVAYLAIGLLFESLPKRPFLAIFLYSITFIFSNFGPNTSTFMLPSLTFRRQARSTLSGVSAAAGKYYCIRHNYSTHVLCNTVPCCALFACYQELSNAIHYWFPRVNQHYLWLLQWFRLVRKCANAIIALIDYILHMHNRQAWCIDRYTCFQTTEYSCWHWSSSNSMCIYQLYSTTHY
jgi:hypothetical protein